MKEDPVFSLIRKEERRQILGAEMIASENFVSPEVLQAMGSILTNKYAEGLPGKRYYGGCEFVDEIEELAIKRAKKLFDLEWVNVQPHSGAQANAAIMMALLKPGDPFVGFDLSHGGHLTHGSAVNFSGKLYQPHFYGVDKETGQIDYKNLRNTILSVRPKLIICGASSYSRDWDYKTFREYADEVGSLLMADIAHPAGLIAHSLLNNPFKYCHILSTTTHKTLRGPRGGMIMMRKNIPNPMGWKTAKGRHKTMGEILDSAVFPGTQGGPHEHTIAAKAIALQEVQTSEFKKYAQQICRNASTLAQALMDRNYQVLSKGTDNHMVLVDLRNKSISGKEAEDILSKVSITVNKNMVPFDDRSPFVTSGIRLGTPALSTRGLKEKDMEKIVDWIDQALSASQDEVHLKKIRKEVQTHMSSFPLFSWA
ncbi:MAG: serine hydroxymethyltransferase [Cytophagales bacterium]|nr:serine hydroxymethyltransferase [Cytophagales bacterium]